VVFDLTDATSPLCTHAVPVKCVVAVVFKFVLDRRQTIEDFLHNCIKVSLYNFSERRNAFFVPNKICAHNQLSLIVVLHIVEPVFLHPLIEFFQRPLEVALDEIEKSLLLFSFKVEPNGVGVAQRTSCSHDKPSNVDQKLVVVRPILRIQF